MGTRDDITKAERLHLAALELKKHNHCREKHDLSYFRKYAKLQHLLKPDVDLQEVARLAEEMKDHCQEISLGSKHASRFAVEVVKELIPSNEIAILDEMAASIASKQYSDWESKKSLSEGSIPTSSSSPALSTSKEDDVSPSITSETSKKSRDKAQAVNDVDSQMQRLEAGYDNSNSKSQDDEDALLEAAINLAAAEREELKVAAKIDEGSISVKCDHGRPPISRGDVLGSFLVSVMEVTDDTLPLHERFQLVHETTKRECAEVWNDQDKLQIVCSFFLGLATEDILLGDHDYARATAMFVSYFEQFSASKILKTQVSCSWGKVRELERAVEQHTIVSFLRKRIPCKCLDKRYEEVKSTPKMGICFNEHCSQPNRMIKRTEMLQCTQCRMVYYCSRRCQKAAWPSHKECCIADARLRDERKSRRKN